jgi:hypothetical protein
MPEHYTDTQVKSPGNISNQMDLEVLLEMLREASRSRDAKEVLAAFARKLWRMNPVEAMVSLSVRDMPKGQYKITSLHSARRGKSRGSESPTARSVEQLGSYACAHRWVPGRSH